MQAIKPQIIQKPQDQSCTQIYIKHTQTSNKFFEELVPSVMLKKKTTTHKARTSWYRGPFRPFINTRFLKNE